MLILSVGLSLFLLFFATGCSSNSSEGLKSNLPIFGHKEVIDGDTVYHTIPEWTYTTQDSNQLSSTDLDNQIKVVDFIFSTCKNVCSPMTYAMKGINDTLSDLSDKITFLSFSIDPNHDTPSVLKKYAKDHGITANNWYFLTGGGQKEINQLAIKQFLVFATKDKDAPGGFAHSQNFILIDSKGRIRGFYDGLNANYRSKLIKDARSLAKTVD